MDLTQKQEQKSDEEAKDKKSTHNISIYTFFWSLYLYTYPTVSFEYLSLSKPK
jgi:hypothetical protein